MKDNGTDRDIAQAFVSVVNDLATLLGTLNDNLYVPHIVTQPTNQTGAIGSNITFTVVANNAVSYVWKYQTGPNEVWRDMHSGATGANTESVTIPVTSTRYGYGYKCVITGKDGSVIDSNTVKILQPEAAG